MSQFDQKLLDRFNVGSIMLMGLWVLEIHGLYSLSLWKMSNEVKSLKETKESTKTKIIYRRQVAYFTQ